MPSRDGPASVSLPRQPGAPTVGNQAGPVPCDENVTVTSTDTVWNLIATELRAAVGGELYEVWLAPLRLVSIDESLVTVSAPPATHFSN